MLQRLCTKDREYYCMSSSLAVAASGRFDVPHSQASVARASTFPDLLHMRWSSDPPIFIRYMFHELFRTSSRYGDRSFFVFVPAVRSPDISVDFFKEKVEMLLLRTVY